MMPKFKKINPFLKNLSYYSRLLNKNLIQDTPYNNFDVLYEGSNGICNSIILNMDSEFRAIQIKQKKLLDNSKIYHILVNDKIEKIQFTIRHQDPWSSSAPRYKLLSYEEVIFKTFKDIIENFVDIFDKNYQTEHASGEISFANVKNKECKEIQVKKYKYISKIVYRGEFEFSNIKDNLLLECYQILQKIKKNNNISHKYKFFVINQHQMMFTKSVSEKNEELEIDLSYSESVKESLQKWFNSYRSDLSIFKGEPKDDPFQICLNLQNIHDSKYALHEVVENKIERIEKDENAFFVYL